MSHAAFLAAIREHPGADLPRLVFADWLDEHGDPARAEFIRVQCELASLPDHDPQYRPLEDREHELLSEHESAWAGELPKYATEWEWRRGFVDEVTLNLESVDHWDEAASEQPISRLSLTSRLDWASLETRSIVSPILEWVRHLDLGNLTHRQLDMLSTGVIGLVLNKEFRRLTSLDLGDALPPRMIAEAFDLSMSIMKRPLKAASFIADYDRHHDDTLDSGQLDLPRLMASFRNTRLELLKSPDSGISGDQLQLLLRDACSESLTHLDISGNPLAPDAYRAFAEARPAMRLQSLDVSGTPLAGISLEPLLDTRACESLTKLEMNGCGSARRNMEVLSRSRFWTQATELRAHSGTIPASTLEPLCGSSGPPALRLLDLADNYLRTDGVWMLCDAPWTEPLTWLALSRNYLDDDSCRALANSRLWNLRTLHLAHNNLSQDRSDGEVITDIGVSWLTDSLLLANLRLLTLSYTGISDRSVDLVLNRAAWRLFGLGIAGNNLTDQTARVLATSPRLARLTWLDISGNPRLGGRVLLPLAESPYLSRMCELDCGGIDMAEEVRAAFRERLGTRFSD